MKKWPWLSSVQIALAGSPRAFFPERKLRCHAERPEGSAVLFRQGKDVKRLAVVRAVDTLQHGRRLVFRTAPAQAGGDGDILPAIDAERDRITLHRRAEARHPKGLSCFDVNRAEAPVKIADKRKIAAG